VHALSIEALPVEFKWNEGTPSWVALHSVIYDFRSGLEEMMARGLITHKDSFGFAMVDPLSDYRTLWDNPERSIAFVAHWGPEGSRYAANAVRKIRPAAREGHDSQWLRINGPYRFRDVVESKDDEGNFPWGDFPYDGAVYVDTLAGRLLGGVSAFPKEEDPIVATLLLGIIGLEMYESNSQLK
jgi:hypothetical protein